MIQRSCHQSFPNHAVSHTKSLRVLQLLAYEVVVALHIQIKLAITTCLFVNLLDSITLSIDMILKKIWFAIYLNTLCSHLQATSHKIHLTFKVKFLDIIATARTPV